MEGKIKRNFYSDNDQCDSEEEKLTGLYEPIDLRKRSSWFWPSRLTRDHGQGILVGAVVAYLSIFVAFLVLDPRLRDRCHDPSQALYSPAQGEIEYSTKIFQRSFAEDVSPYQGWPDDEKDEMWKDLHKHGVAVHVTKEEARDFADATEHVAVEGLEGEYLLGLAVSHDLHCLDILRKSFFPERYPTFGLYLANGTINKMGWRHIDHCIDGLRQAIMCHADISLTRFKWISEAYFMKPQLDIAHTCRNFDRINNWAAQRSIYGHYKYNAHVEADGKVKMYPDIFPEDPSI